MESVTVTVTDAFVTAAVGAQVKVIVVPLHPVGSPDQVKVRPPDPPDVVVENVTPCPTSAPETFRVGAETVGSVLTVKVPEVDGDDGTPFESVTTTVTVYGPGAVGMQVMDVALFRAQPREGDDSVHV